MADDPLAAVFDAAMQFDETRCPEEANCPEESYLCAHWRAAVERAVAALIVREFTTERHAHSSSWANRMMQGTVYGTMETPDTECDRLAYWQKRAGGTA